MAAGATKTSLQNILGSVKCLRLFHVRHVVLGVFFVCLIRIVSMQRKRVKVYSSGVAFKYENFTSSYGRLRQRIALESVNHAHYEYFSLFSQSYHSFVVLPLPFPLPQLGSSDYKQE